jgi:peroxiredoxin
VAQLRRKKQYFEQAGAQVVLVGMGTPEESAAFKMKFDIPFPLISDPKRQLYQAFGLKKVSTLELLSPFVAVKGILAITKGHTVGIPVGDVRQLPGVFIINTDGRIIYSYFASDPSDHPSPDTILEALKTADYRRSASKVHIASLTNGFP